jgi:ribosome maturation factor RimP
MIEKGKIEKIVDEFIKGTDIFLVAVRAGNSNRISVLADTRKGITIDECASLHRHIEKQLDRNIEDYDLLVSSPGADTPFMVIEQYRKNEGRKVDVVDIDGLKYSGTLKNVTVGGFELETEVRVKGKGREMKDISFNFDQVKSTKEVLVIK